MNKNIDNIIKEAVNNVINEMFEKSSKDILANYNKIINMLINAYNYDDGIIHSRDISLLKSNPKIYNNELEGALNILLRIENDINALKNCSYVRRITNKNKNYLNENTNNSRELKKIQRKIYNLAQKYNGIYHDEAWENVHKLIDSFNNIEGVIDVNCSSGVYYNYLNFSNNNSAPYRDYEVTIDTEYGQLGGYVRCCAAGTMADPFSGYDIVISIYPK